MARIALVETDSALAAKLQSLLAIEGHTVTRFSDSGEALLAIQDGSFELVVSGIAMPKLDGFSLCRALRARHGKWDLPILLIAREGQDSDLLRGYEAGANDYLVEPLVSQSVAEKLDLHLGKRGTTSESRDEFTLGEGPPELPCPYDQYVLLETLGRGGYAHVYRSKARDGGTVALKLFHEDIEDDRSVLARYFREVALLGRLSSPYIVKVHGSGYAQGRFYIAMELIPGKSAGDLLIESGPFRFKSALRIGLEMSEALAAFAGAGLVHRDVKPTNIVVRSDGQSALVDLGLAKDPSEAGVTGFHELLGTAAFLAPETIRGEVVTIASDIYSLGATIFCLLCGEPPFHMEDEYLLLRTVGSGRRARALNTVRCDTRDSVSAFIAKLLEPRGERRPTPLEAAAGFHKLLRM